MATNRHLPKYKTWVCVILLLCMILYLVSIYSKSVKPGLKLPPLPPIFDGNTFYLSWNQTQDARLPCDSVYTDAIWHPALSDLARTCNPSIYLQFGRTGQIKPTASKSGIPSNLACPRMPIRAPFRLPSTGLVSWPGSGNTWTRHLIQQLTGLWTGAVYHDKDLKTNGFPGEALTDGVVVIKTHFTAVPGTKIAIFHKQILVIRNPYDAFVAAYKFYTLGAGHRGKVNINPNTTGWLNFIPDRIPKWKYFIRASLAFNGPQLIVMYEDLKECLLRELVYIAKFLETPDLQKFSVCCANNNSEGRNHRKMGRSPLYQLYQPKLRAIMNSFLNDMSKRMASEFPVLSKRLLGYRLL